MATDQGTPKPGNSLAKVDKDAHDATYDKDGTLKIKNEVPVAAVSGGEVGTADTGVKAKIQEPVSGATVNPIDTVDKDSLNESAREANQPAKVEDRDGNVKVDEDAAKAEHKAKEETLKAAGADDTEAAKNAVKSQKENKAEESRETKTPADKRVGK